MYNPRMSNLSMCEEADDQHFQSMVVPDSDLILSPIQDKRKNELDQLSMQVNHNKKKV